MSEEQGKQQRKKERILQEIPTAVYSRLAQLVAGAGAGAVVQRRGGEGGWDCSGMQWDAGQVAARKVVERGAKGEKTAGHRGGGRGLRRRRRSCEAAG